ncbi:MAG: MFS transporter [Firmicutes bacterium]|nr:MFS transporter [Bacillota bacterium]
MLKEYLQIIKKPNIWISSLSLFLLLSSASTWVFVLPIFLRDLGASQEQVGTAYFAFLLSFSLFQALGGFLGDRYGRKKIIALPTFILPVVYIAAAFSKDWITIMVYLTIGNLIQGLQAPSIYALIAESVESKDLGLGFSILEIAISASYVAGPFIGMFFSSSEQGIRNMMILTGIVMIPCGFLRWVGLKDSVEHSAFKIKIGDIIKSFNPNLILLLFAFIFFYMMLDATFYGPFLSQYAKDQIGLTNSSIQALIMLAALASIFFNFINGKLTGKLGSRKSLIIGSLGHVLLFLPWLFSNNLFTAALCFIPSYLFMQLSYIGHDTIMSDLTSVRTRSTIMGIFSMVPGILGSLSPEIGSRIAVIYGPKAPFYMAVVFGLIAATLLVPIKSKRI